MSARGVRRHVQPAGGCGFPASASPLSRVLLYPVASAPRASVHRALPFPGTPSPRAPGPLRPRPPRERGGGAAAAAAAWPWPSRPLSGPRVRRHATGDGTGRGAGPVAFGRRRRRARGRDERRGPGRRPPGPDSAPGAPARQPCSSHRRLRGHVRALRFGGGVPGGRHQGAAARAAAAPEVLGRRRDPGAPDGERGGRPPCPRRAPRRAGGQVGSERESVPPGRLPLRDPRGPRAGRRAAGSGRGGGAPRGRPARAPTLRAGVSLAAPRTCQPGGGRDAGARPLRLWGRPGVRRAGPNRCWAPGAGAGRARELCSPTSRASRVSLTQFPTREGCVAPTPTSFAVIGRMTALWRMLASGRGSGSSVPSRPWPGGVERGAHARRCGAGRCCLQAGNSPFFR